MRILVIFLLFLSTTAFSQSRDSLVYNLRNIDWPLVPLKGQVKAQLGADYSLGSRGYDSEGNKFVLIDRQEAYFATAVSANIQYGITDFIALRSSIRHINELRRFETVSIQSEEVDGQLFVQSISAMSEVKGFDDLGFSLDFKFPPSLKKYDIILSAGVLLPTGNSGFQQPLNRNSSESAGTEEIVFHDITNPGNGVLSYNFGGAVKVRGANIAASIFVDYILPSSESKNSYWTYTLDGNDYNYTSREYDVQMPERLDLQGLVEYQVNPFFNAFLGFQKLSSRGGWEQPFDNKIALLNTSVTNLNLGLDLISSPNFWLRQMISIPVGGKSEIAPVVFSTLITFNKF